ncbi:MAG: hypothetical protein ACHQEM_04860 [Chitinophagales bacterium]
MCKNDCKANKSIRRGRDTGILSGLLLLLIPKCPFCFMAYSSVMVFCGQMGVAGQSSRSFYSESTLILTSVFCLTALLSILIYYRPVHGKYALLLAIPGTITLVISVTAFGGMQLYYFGATLVLAGLLRNSGFWSFLISKFSIRKKLLIHLTEI